MTHRILSSCAVAAMICAMTATESPWLLPDPLAPAPGGGPEHSQPVSFPDGEGFARRRQLVFEILAGEDLARWRRGYFRGGDPGKYLPGAAMAKLLIDPDDAMARQYMNDDRSYRELYHFAGLNWSRFLPAFGDALTERTRNRLYQQMERYRPYLDGGGTENHRIMQYSAGLVLPWYTGSQTFAQTTVENALANRAAWLRGYVKELYRSGMGEWDSSTYAAFCIHGMMNVYDFSKDESVRAWARAALDWYVAWYALKYLDGVQAGPSQRGASARVAGSITDQTGWIWWGSRAEEADIAGGFRYAMHAATSGWRPNAVLSRLAAKDPALLPIEQFNTKPNYYFGQQIEPRKGNWAESLWYDRGVGMGSLWRGHGGQATRFSAVATSANGAQVIFGGTPIGRNDGSGNIQRYKYEDGNGRYDQTAMVGGTHVCLSVLPDDEPLDYAFVTLPEGVVPEQHDGWWVMPLGDAWVGIHGVVHGGELGESHLTERQQQQNQQRLDAGQEIRHHPRPLLRFPGHRTGFVLTLLPVGLATDAASARAALEAQSLTVDAEALAAAFTTQDGRAVQVAYRPEQRQGAEPAVIIDGEAVNIDQWAVGSGPKVAQEDGILRLWDGQQGYQIDVTGAEPVWQDYAGPQP